MITLTTPKNTGDVDPNGPFNKTRITWWRIDTEAEIVSAMIELGKVVSNVWVACIEEVAVTNGWTRNIGIKGVAPNDVYYNAIVAATPEGEETAHEAIVREIETAIIALGVVDGTVDA